jgi:hypothetical protein
MRIRAGHSTKFLEQKIFESLLSATHETFSLVVIICWNDGKLVLDKKQFYKSNGNWIGQVRANKTKMG